jgi:uncharacterized protein (DUF1697 family)
MIYIALLRGINVGGKAKVAMVQLKKTFEQLGFHDVTTYINSGNVVFTSDNTSCEILASKVEKAVKKDFKLDINILVLDKISVEKIVRALPGSWTNDKLMKCDVLFLWPKIDNPKIIDQIEFKPDIENVIYTPGALIWRIDRENATKGSSVKLIKTDLYKFMTIRNSNTVRKIAQIMARN